MANIVDDFPRKIEFTPLRGAWDKYRLPGNQRESSPSVVSL